jgi:hypothetical protein
VLAVFAMENLMVLVKLFNNLLNRNIISRLILPEHNYRKSIYISVLILL